MKDIWRKVNAWFDALVTRERALVLLAAIAGTALVYDALALQPLEARKKRLTQQIVDARQNIKAAEALLKTQDVADPDAVKRSYRDAVRAQLAEIDQSMQGLQRGLVPPERMAKLLEEMLAHGRGLQLIGLRSLPVQQFETPGAAAAKADDKAVKGAKPAAKDPQRAIYQHGFEISLQGSYPDLLEYLAQLEKLEWQMFWTRISVNTDQYPKLRVTLTVQTLSLNKAWLIV